MNELPMIDGWILYSWAFLNDPVHKFSGIYMKDSPEALESDDLLKELKEIYKKQVK